jgi:hypothetical protein
MDFFCLAPPKGDSFISEPMWNTLKIALVFPASVIRDKKPNKYSTENGIIFLPIVK